MKYCIIVNPISGHRLGEKSVLRIESVMKNFGPDKTFAAHPEGEFICLSGSHLELELLPLVMEIICA